MIRKRATAPNRSNNCSGWEVLAREHLFLATSRSNNGKFYGNNGNSSNVNNKTNPDVWGMMKTGVEGTQGWRGRTQRRTTLFTSRDGWDSSVGWL